MVQDFHKKVTVDNDDGTVTNLTLNIWDAAGDSNVHNLAHLFVHNVQCGILVYGVDSKVSFDAAWTEDKAEMESNKNKALVYLALFAFTSTNLIISIIRTITTNPGNIPDHKEWDMSTDTSGGEEAGSLISRSAENEEEKKKTAGE